ncbi:hypothetical protein NKR19_g7574 [Coniochaeta hoffmannii]|uniref:DUF6594 domain-containing protein n=1 Tax=Coniochaeta hoffmannii TaxID=91930 RepID=A0AA38R6W2_9PEZI|nr:hypothetical protein NKR19_g7574 [Coniochaeta hoffmannii]
MELPRFHPPPENSQGSATGGRKQNIEDYRPGYPRFTALLSAYDPYLLCRRFSRLRARILLLKQDKLSLLEQRLDEVDREEVCPLFLGMSRSDRNAQRASVLEEIESSLTEYDAFAERTHKMLSLNPAQRRDVESLGNWLDGTGCVAGEETAYLGHHQDLVSLAPAGDNAVLQLEAWVEDKFIRFDRRFNKNRDLDTSSDPNVYIYSGHLIKNSVKALLLLLITFLLLLPVVICNLVSTVSIRIAVVMASTIFYLLVISQLTRSKTMDLVLAGATYATVLIVFISGTGNSDLGG